MWNFIDAPSGTQAQFTMIFLAWVYFLRNMFKSSQNLLCASLALLSAYLYEISHVRNAEGPLSAQSNSVSWCCVTLLWIGLVTKHVRTGGGWRVKEGRGGLSNTVIVQGFGWLHNLLSYPSYLTFFCPQKHDEDWGGERSRWKNSACTTVSG